nr:unknown protein [Rattus norvegicus]AAP13974.1 orf4 [Rattus sp.]
MPPRQPWDSGKH